MSDRELSPAECVDLISSGGVGRIVYCTTSGPAIYPVNFAVDGDAIVIRTAAYSALGTHVVTSPRVAFEVDEIDHEHLRGWSVVAQGVAEPIEDPEEMTGLHPSARLVPWAEGTRNLFVRVRWQTIQGRRVGSWTES